jgi:hypothetical protein
MGGENQKNTLVQNVCNRPFQQYSRGYKKRAIAEKMFGTLAIFSDSLQGYFSTFFFFLLSEDSKFAYGKFFFGHLSQRGHQRRPQS